MEGLLILREDAKVGQPFAEYLGRTGSDVVYDLEITPNRPDLNSVIGIAREISAVTGNPLKLPQIKLSRSRQPAAGQSLVAVRIEDAELCPRYTARVVRGVKIAPSPDWLKSTLEKVGIRSINNVVDVTNYVMLETGQPLHAFDYHLLERAGVRPAQHARPTIVIRRAAEGEKFMTLDGQERTLTSQMLLIADETKAVALAGVMGGQNSEINLNTVDVLIESACFKPQNIRATSKKLDLRTESSYRFERGRRHRDLRLGQPARGPVDPGNGRRHAGARRGGCLSRSPSSPSKSPCATRRRMPCWASRCPMEQQIESLQRLGLEVATAAGIASLDGRSARRTRPFSACPPSAWT